MKIAQIAPIEERVPPESYGGTELVVGNITEELVARGHEVTLFASGNSKTSAHLVSLSNFNLRAIKTCQKDQRLKEALKSQALYKLFNVLRVNKFDIIHQHFGWRLKYIADLIEGNFIETLHQSFEEKGMRSLYQTVFPKNLVSISLSQQRFVPELNFIANIYHGINLKQFELTISKGDYFAFLGRTSAQKGIKEAILYAKNAHVKLKIAAKVDNADKEYFKKEVEPLIDNRQIEFIGEVGPAEKNKFLGGARALLAPIQWEEPFGLYFVEAMACGTPVIVFDRGSAREVIKDKETGFICPPNDHACFLKSIRIVDDLSPAQRYRTALNCRSHVEDNFTIKKMVDNYEQVYQKVLTLSKLKKMA